MSVDAAGIGGTLRDPDLPSLHPEFKRSVTLKSVYEAQKALQLNQGCFNPILDSKLAEESLHEGTIISQTY